MNIKFAQIFTIALLSTMIGCTSSKNITGPGQSHGDINLPPLLVITDTTQLHVSGNDSIPPPQFVPYDTSREAEPRTLRRIVPEYPKSEERKGIQADVWIKVWVNKNGHISQSAVFKSTDDRFNYSAAVAGLKFEFKPAQIKGEPVSMWAIIPFLYRIH